MPSMRVVIAPDSYKGTINAKRAAHAIAQGWALIRPGDDLIILPQADGGENTCEVIASCTPHAMWRNTPGQVPGPDGRPVSGRWLMLPDKTAVVELALVSGFSQMKELNCRRAQTRGLGAVLREVCSEGCARILVGLGGSASTDGGSGALSELGMRFLDCHAEEIQDGASGLAFLSAIDGSRMTEPPAGGVQLLCDTAAPLFGSAGAAAVFGPQKGANSDDIEFLDATLVHYAGILGGDPMVPGSGAAGGTAFGLTQAWGASIVSGSQKVAFLTGLTEAVKRADLLITGEGSFDASSMTGKVVNNALDLAQRNGVRCVLIAGKVSDESQQVIEHHAMGVMSLCEIAGSVKEACSSPLTYLQEAGIRLARSYGASNSDTRAGG